MAGGPGATVPEGVLIDFGEDHEVTSKLLSYTCITIAYLLVSETKSQYCIAATTTMETTVPQAMQASGENMPQPQRGWTEDSDCEKECSGAAQEILRELSTNYDLVTSQDNSNFWAHAPDPQPWLERINKSPTPPTGDGTRNPRNEDNFTRNTPVFTGRGSGNFESRPHRPRRRRELTRREILEKLVEQHYLPRLTDPSKKPRHQHKPRPFYPTPVRTQRVYISPEELALIKKQRGETSGDPSANGGRTGVINNHPSQSSPQPRVATPFDNDTNQQIQNDAAINQTTAFPSALDAQGSNVNIFQTMVSDKAHLSSDPCLQASTMLVAPFSRISILAESSVNTPQISQWTPRCVPDIHSGLPTMAQTPASTGATNSSSTAASSIEPFFERESPPLIVQTTTAAIYEPQTPHPLISSLASSPYVNSYTADLASLAYPVDFTFPVGDEGVSVQTSPRNDPYSPDNPVDFISGQGSTVAAEKSPASSNSLASSHTTRYSTSLNDLIGLEFF